MISSPLLATSLIYYVSRRWSLYLNKCVAALASKLLEAPGANNLFSLNSILVEIEGGRYVRLILLVPLAEILAGRRLVRGGGNYGGRSTSGGGSGGVLEVKGKKVGANGGDARVRARYNAHLPPLSL